jgi:hypothetical protein
MTSLNAQEQIKSQIEALKKATENATKSKKAANKYLRDAGIIPKKEGKFASSKKK